MGERFTMLALALSVLTGCQSGAVLGTTCARSNECASPLVCRLGRCRNECSEARDCAAGQVCLIGADHLGACEVPSVDTCTVSCDAPLVCASGHCRVECTADGDCPGGHVCARNACQRADVDAGPIDDAGADAGADGGADASSDAGTDAAQPTDSGLVPADVGLADAGLVCDPVAQRGCSGGMRCGLVSGVPECVMAGGTAALGASCTAESDCAAGLSCQGDRCVHVCYFGDDAFCGADSACSYDSVSGQSFLHSANGIGLCAERCDPLTNTGCPASATCGFATGNMGNDFTWCRDIGAVMEGGACAGEYQCAAGLTCKRDPSCDGGACRFCRPFCSTTADCTTGTCENISSFRTRPQIGACQ